MSACGVVDHLVALIGVHDDILQVSTHGEAKQTYALGGTPDLDVPNGIGVTVVVGGEIGRIGLRIGAIVHVSRVHHAADRGEGMVVGAAESLGNGVHVMALDPVAAGLIGEVVLSR